MLVLSRKIDEEIILGRDIRIKVISISDTSVKIGISAPKEIQIIRPELIEKVKENMIAASKSINEKIDVRNHKINKKT